MKRIFVKEQYCLGCHLCEYYCTFANSGVDDMAKAFNLKGIALNPRVRVEESGDITYAVNCRHCEEPLCVYSCITGAMQRGQDGLVFVDKERCVGCYTCLLVCPYGAVKRDTLAEKKAILKCELCTNNNNGTPACVQNCPNKAIILEEREGV